MTIQKHDPAQCFEVACERCDDYGAGYAAGKAKAHFELRNHALQRHEPGCRCDNCQTVLAWMNFLMTTCVFEGLGLTPPEVEVDEATHKRLRAALVEVLMEVDASHGDKASFTMTDVVADILKAHDIAKARAGRW